MITISKKIKLTVRVISLALVLCICLSVVMTPKAHAISELIIVGAIALTLGAVASVVILAAEPLGLKEPIMAAAQHGFQSPREFIANLLDRFGASQGIQRFVMLDKFQKGLMITAAGKVILDKAISDFLTDFYEWAWEDTGGGLINFVNSMPTQTVWTNTTGQFPDYGPITGVQTYSWTLSSSGTVRQVIVSSPGVIVRTHQSINGVYALGIGAFSYEVYDNGVLNTSLSKDATYYSNNLQNYFSSTLSFPNYSSTSDLVETPIDTSITLNTNKARLAYIMAHGTEDVIGGDPTYEEDGLTLPAPSMSNVLDVPGALSLPAPIFGTTTATQYLEAAADAITAGTGSLEYEDTYGNTQTGTLEGTGAIDLTQVGAQSAELEGAIDIADSVGSETLDNYTIDLRDFFPFCIPFDLRDMLHLLESAPAPVSVEWQFDFGQLGDFEMEINLEEWNSVAQTLRTMELLAFCFGLAMLTKRILMGS